MVEVAARGKRVDQRSSLGWEGGEACGFLKQWRRHRRCRQDEGCASGSRGRVSGRGREARCATPAQAGEWPQQELGPGDGGLVAAMGAVPASEC